MDKNYDHLPVLPSNMTKSPAVLLTPGRTRNIAQDMEALRLSRHDNPYLQQVMASRESLIESNADECDSDDTILMSQDYSSGRSPRRIKGFDISLGRSRNSRSASPRAYDFSIGGRPLSLPGESHLRNALGRKQSNQPTERFSLLQQRIGRRNDSERLVNCDD